MRSTTRATRRTSGVGNVVEVTDDQAFRCVRGLPRPGRFMPPTVVSCVMNDFGGDVELRRLLDRQAIHDVVLRYCRGIDRMDLDAVRECYHPDATDEHGSFSGSVDAYLAWIGRLLPRYSSTMHLTGNHLVDFSSDTPDLARSETYGMAFHRSADPSPRGNLVTGF